MLINDPHFKELLERTKIYCARQTGAGQKPVASLFRSLNPVAGKQHIFNFSPFTSVALDKKDCMLANWTKDPLDTNGLIKKLFIYQQQEKRNIALDISPAPHEGAILVSHFGETPVYGASAIASCGFMDDYDLPPIDTWFYLLDGFLYSWVPQQFLQQVQAAIDVNCVDCITWFHREGKMVYGKHPI